MRIKSQKITGIIFIILGIVLELFFATVGETDYKGGMLVGMGSCFIVIGIIYVLKAHRLSKNAEKAADYEAALTDERIAYIVSKARSVTFYISIFVQLLAGLICIWVLDQRSIGEVFIYLTCFQCLLYYVIFLIFNKKY